MHVEREVQQDKSKEFWCKIFLTRQDFVVGMCDQKLLGTVLNFKSKKVKIKVSKEFYGGVQIDEKIAVRIMKRATIANLMGAQIVELAEKNGFISKENIILINEVPHAQFVKII